MTEPLLTDKDRYLWSEVWTPAFHAHVTTRAFRQRHARALELARQALDLSPTPLLMVSGGKDSTALGELVCGELGARPPGLSEKDDLDYPGEEEHLDQLGQRWGVEVKIVRPAVSLQGWLKEHGQGLSASDDLHSRLSAFSQAGFYGVIEPHTRGCGVVLLGLRKEESRHRLVDRATHGPLHRWTSGPQAGTWRACPLIDWTGLDVLAYCVSRGAPLLPLYRCIAFPPEYRQEPWRIRKSWWLPGKSARWGGAAWLRRYYPSLFLRLCELFPDARSMA